MKGEKTNDKPRIFVCRETRMIIQTETEHKRCPFCNKPVELDRMRN